MRRSVNKKSAIPIPSFETTSTTVSGSVLTHSLPPLSTTTTTRSSRDAVVSATSLSMVLPCWNHLLQVEAALQLRFKNRTNVVIGNNNDSLTATKKLISLQEFFALIKKLNLSIAATNRHGRNDDDDTALEDAGDVVSSQLDNNNHQHYSRLLLLSTEEQVLHDLVCVSEPVLYRLIETSSSSRKHNSDGVAVVTSNNNETRWSLESVEFSGNRLIELKKIMQQLEDQLPTNWRNKSDRIVRVIESCRPTSSPPSNRLQQQSIDTAAAAAAGCDGNDNSNSESIQNDHSQDATVTKKARVALADDGIHSNMTLEERVRARAAASKSRQKTPVTAGTSLEKKESDASLLSYADALWSHARSIMSRHQASMRFPRTGSANVAAPPPPPPPSSNCCILTLKDAVEVLSRTTSNQQAAATASRRQMVDAVHRISQLTPEWIVLSDPECNRPTSHLGKGSSKTTTTKNNNEGRRLSKDTTVWIKSVEYGVIRRKLEGTSTTTTARVIVATDPSTDATNSKKKSKTTTFKPESTSIPKATMMNTRSSSHTTRDPPDTSWQETPLAKKARTRKDFDSSSSSSSSRSKRVQENVAGVPMITPSNVASNESKNLFHSTQRYRVGLRVNNNLIFTDADYVGGEIIEPTQFDSPRGLKRLFAQLNSGQRI